MNKVVHTVRIGNYRLDYVECADGSITLALYDGVSLWAVAYGRMSMGIYGAWGANVPQFATDILSPLI